MSEISNLASSLGGLIGWFLLVLLPGGWITFGLSLTGFPFWMRLLMGTALAPFIVCLEFYALRLLGFSFELTALLLVAVNLPVLYLIYRRREEVSFPDFKTILGVSVVLLIPISLLLPQILDSQIRVFTGHGWMQSDVIYMLANGNLWLEEPELAGLRLDYPWAAHPFQAVLSYLLNSPPAVNYIWTNLVSFISIYGFSAYIVKELGGNRFSQITAFLWLVFGLNFFGYVFFTLIPSAIAGTFWMTGDWNFTWIGGDYRITPWMLKYFFFEQGILGSSILCAIIYLLIKTSSSTLTTDILILLGLLLCAIGFIYPVFFSTAFILVCAFAFTIFLDRAKPENRNYLEKCLRLGAVLLASSALTYAFVKFLTVDRATKSMILPSLSIYFAKSFLVKSVSSGVVLALYLGGILFTLRKYWKDNQNKIIILLIGGLSGVLFYVLVEIPHPSAEYKFLLTTAPCLAAFPALALQPFLERIGKKRIVVFSVIAFMLFAPAAHKIYLYYPWTLREPPPAVDTSEFNLKLDKREPLSAVCETIRKNTPLETILVIEKSEIHLPTLTQRPLYAPPSQDKVYPGVMIPSWFLLKILKGYDKKLLDDRRLVVQNLFQSSDNNLRTESLNQILQLNRPIAILFKTQENSDLRDFFRSDNRNLQLFENEVWRVWLISPR